MESSFHLAHVGVLHKTVVLFQRLSSYFSIFFNILILGILPNCIPFILRYNGYTASHMHINVDYFYLGITSFFLPKLATVIFFFLLYIIDGSVIISDIAHYPLSEALYWSHQASSSVSFAHLHLFASYLIMGGLLILLHVIIPKKFYHQKTTAYLFLSLALLLTTSRLLQDTFLNETYWSSHRVVSSGLYRFFLATRDISNTSPRTLPALFSTLPPSHSATSMLFQKAHQTEKSLAQHNIALILVESLGNIQDPLLKQEMFASFQKNHILSRYKLSMGTAPFLKATLNGEFRELCNVVLYRYGELSLPKCLPSYLKEIGFETTSYHGYMRYFYERQRWYPKIGFTKSYFFDEMERMGLAKCKGAFLGICDFAVASLMEQKLLEGTSEHPQFTHWITLTSHLTINHDIAQDSQFNCAPYHQLNDQPLCDYFKVIHRTLSAIADVAANPNLPPTQFIIVGDHAPGFLRSFRRNMFAEDTVSYLILDPKDQFGTNPRLQHPQL